MLIVNKTTLYFNTNSDDKFRWNFIKFLLIEDDSDFIKFKKDLVDVYLKTYEKMEDYHYKDQKDIEKYIDWLYNHKTNNLNKSVIIVAFDNNNRKVIGFIAGDTYYYDKELQSFVIAIHEICVIPEYQGLKIGHYLMYEILEFAKKHNKENDVKAKYSILFVGAKNYKAINFYKKLGYNYLSEHGKWIKMVLHLE
mgnify:CR=1 FL=1